MTEKISALERQLSLIHEITSTPARDALGVDFIASDSQRFGRLLHDSPAGGPSDAPDQPRWVAAQVEKLRRDSQAVGPPHPGKCSCPPRDPANADAVVLDQLRAAAGEVEIAEARRDRLVDFAVRATGLTQGEIAQAAGLNRRTIARRVDAVSQDPYGQESRAEEYRDLSSKALAEEGSSLHEALLAVGGPSDTTSHGIDIAKAARELGVSRRTVERWLNAPAGRAGRSRARREAQVVRGIRSRQQPTPPAES